MIKDRYRVRGARYKVSKLKILNRKDAKCAKENILIVKTNTKAVAGMAGVFIDSDCALFNS